MPKRPDVPPAVQQTLDTLLRQAGEATRADDLRRSYSLDQQAWDALPDPKTDWDFYPQIIARNMLDKSVALRDRSRAEHWLRTRRGRPDAIQPAVLDGVHFDFRDGPNVALTWRAGFAWAGEEGDVHLEGGARG